MLGWTCFIFRNTQFGSVSKHLQEGDFAKKKPHLLWKMVFLQERLNSTVGNVSEIIELVSKYDWDFDNYLEEDVPAAVWCCFVFSTL